MSDPKDEAVAEPPKPEPAQHHQAKVGVKDAGEIVTTAGGELIDGRIADITDGDKPHRR
jgi:hypothetical protein